VLFDVSFDSFPIHLSFRVQNHCHILVVVWVVESDVDDGLARIFSHLLKAQRVVGDDFDVSHHCSGSDRFLDLRVLVDVFDVYLIARQIVVLPF